MQKCKVNGVRAVFTESAIIPEGAKEECNIVDMVCETGYMPLPAVLGKAKKNDHTGGHLIYLKSDEKRLNGVRVAELGQSGLFFGGGVEETDVVNYLKEKAEV